MTVTYCKKWVTTYWTEGILRKIENISWTSSLSDMRQYYIYLLGRGWNGASPSHGGRGGGGGDRGSRAPLSPRNPRYEELVSYYTVCQISLVQFTEYTPYMKRTRVFGYTVGFMPFLIVFS